MWDEIVSLAAAPDGAIWFATESSRITRFDGTVWIASEGGISRLALQP